MSIKGIFIKNSGAAARELWLYSFEYNQNWLENQYMMLDPDLQLYKGRQYLNDDKNIFGVFADSCPDRWGQKLMKRREELRAKKAGEKPKKLLESDYLLGVYDEARMGGLRFKTDLDGEFLSHEKEFTTPPCTSYMHFKGALTENYIMTQLKCMGVESYFWRSKENAEIDFISDYEGLLLPIEVKSADNTKAKSLHMFCNGYCPKMAIKTSLKNVGDNMDGKTHVWSLPLYAIFRLKEYVVHEMGW